tara:strand:+ start:3278 stop:3874 length:597 start_codon:yes stop_codon:yes gene_type:complete
MKFLFDLGGVFFDWDPNYFFKDIFFDSNEKDYFLNEVCNDEWNIKQDAGRTIKEAEKALIPLFPKYKNEIKLYYKHHRKMIKGTFLESIKVLQSLVSQNLECYVLSNWSAETFKGMIDEYPFLNLFNGLLISGEVGLIKPDLKIYELAINKFNLDPKNCLFIDDKLENIKAAKELDFKVIHLVDPVNIDKEFQKYLKK